jgi:hypothetical protein
VSEESPPVLCQDAARADRETWEGLTDTLSLFAETQLPPTVV